MCPLLTKLRFVLLIQHSDVPPLHKTPVYPVHTTVINILSTQHPGVSSLCNTLMCPLCKNLWFILSIQNSLVYLYNTQLNTQYKTLMCPSPQNSLPSYNTIIYPIYTRPWCILFIQHFDVPLLHKSLGYPLNTTPLCSPLHKTMVYSLNTKIWCILSTQHSGVSFLYHMCSICTNLCFILSIQPSCVFLTVLCMHYLSNNMMSLFATLWCVFSTQNSGASSS